MMRAGRLPRDRKTSHPQDKSPRPLDSAHDPARILGYIHAHLQAQCHGGGVKTQSIPYAANAARPFSRLACPARPAPAAGTASIPQTCRATHRQSFDWLGLASVIPPLTCDWLLERAQAQTPRPAVIREGGVGSD